MYTHQEERSVEAVCFENDHIDKVMHVIKTKFEEYFQLFIELEAGYSISEKAALELSKVFKVQESIKKKSTNLTVNFKNIIAEGLAEFEKDRGKYQAIFDKEALEEYTDDPSYFKSTVLKNECPIIHATIHNKRAKELDKYRYEFNISDAGELLNVVTNLYYFAEDYHNDFYNKDTYDQISNYSDLEISDLDTDDYIVYGVIGGGIKSQMLYKVYPSVFPNRSRDAIWALWYLSEKKAFDCLQGSEFLMIDINKFITQQNYFYPYELFAFYAHQIFQLLKQKAEANKVYLNPDYRYVIVDSFLSFIAEQHADDISVLKQQIKDGGFEYA